MRKQFTKGTALSLLIVAIALLTAATSYGQSSRKATANIPFDFVVGNTNFHAGEYNIDAISNAGETLRISNAESGLSAVRLTSSVTSLDLPGKTKLVFHRYGSSYYLAEVWRAGESAGRQLVKSAGEKAAEHELAAIQLKRQGVRSGFERVEVAATIQ